MWCSLWPFLLVAKSLLQFETTPWTKQLKETATKDVVISHTDLYIKGHLQRKTKGKNASSCSVCLHFESKHEHATSRQDCILTEVHLQYTIKNELRSAMSFVNLLFFLSSLKKKYTHINKVPCTYIPSLSKETNPLEYYYLKGNGEKNQRVSQFLSIISSSTSLICLSSTASLRLDWNRGLGMHLKWWLASTKMKWLSVCHTPHYDRVLLMFYICSFLLASAKLQKSGSFHSWTPRKYCIILWKLLFQEWLF